MTGKILPKLSLRANHNHFALSGALPFIGLQSGPNDRELQRQWHRKICKTGALGGRWGKTEGEREIERERGEKSWRRMRELSEKRPFFDHVDTMWTRRRKLRMPQQSGTCGIASCLSSSCSHKQLCHSTQCFLRTLRNIFSKCQVSPAPSRLMCQRFFFFFFHLGSLIGFVTC